ncbi:MAG: hypothetical protein MRT15_10590 [archaeon YNP-LCB-003-016]|uniref:hypothetical protein n=1 Tax=Candidatus Culexarchaeum yellowstonense TaxID=2928963 RepID=UPI0026EDD9E3|nr:hypothetical protein [Candidatus Culexarchaeum yellowstonense]MCR6692829.1 hypothetical protein [Candidatus Culexarchaeum yellowstonense]
MLKGIGKIIWTRSRRSYYILVPEEVAMDSSFPFKRGERVLIEVDVENKALIIRRGE